MSAICSIYRFDGAPVPQAAIAALLDRMASLGPEATTWTPETAEAPVGLGCRPLRITPEDAWYRPPLRSTDGQLILVADARIDNRAELAADLGLRAADTAGTPDAAFILAAYEAWGDDCARRLLGDFAFILWDQRRRRLFGARDGLGMRLLCYHASPERLALATMPQALLALGDVAPRLNEQKVAESLVLFQDPATTFFAGILRLPRAHTFTATPEGIRMERYWSPRPTRMLTFRSDQDYVDGFNEVFDRAVSDRLRSSSPVGILLSGGLDSTAVAASAAARLSAEGRRLHAYHAAPRLEAQCPAAPGMIANESADVEAFARLYPNLELRIHRTDARTPFDGVETRFRMAGLPPRNPGNAGWFEGIFSAAQADGIRVLLTGDQGNNTMSYDGRRLLVDLARRFRWARLWQEVSALAKATGNGRRDVLKEQVLVRLLPPGISARLGWLRKAEPPATALLRFSAIKPEFAAATGVEAHILARANGRGIRELGSLEHRLLGLSLPADAPDVLNGYRAWFGIETRDPASDRRVVEYCLAIPASQYLRNGRTRWLVRRALAGRVPEPQLSRTTYGAQAADWSEWLPLLRGTIGAELDQLERSETARRCLDLARLRALVTQWPEPLRPEHEVTYVVLLLRGIMMGRFIRWFESTYN